jgi:hypothetical protein
MTIAPNPEINPDPIAFPPASTIVRNVAALDLKLPVGIAFQYLNLTMPMN